jgi:hypothetical protein
MIIKNRIHATLATKTQHSFAVLRYIREERKKGLDWLNNLGYSKQSASDDT